MAFESDEESPVMSEGTDGSENEDEDGRSANKTRSAPKKKTRSPKKKTRDKKNKIPFQEEMTKMREMHPDYPPINDRQMLTRDISSWREDVKTLSGDPSEVMIRAEQKTGYLSKQEVPLQYCHNSLGAVIKQSDTGKEPDAVIKQSDTGKEPDAVSKQSDTGKEPDAVSKQSDTGKEPDVVSKQSDTGKEPDAVSKQSDTGKEPEAVSKQSDTGKEPDAQSDTGKEPDAVSKQSDTGKEPDAVSKQSDTGKEPEEVSKQSDTGKEPDAVSKQSDTGKEPEAVSKQSDTGKEPDVVSKQSDTGKEPYEVSKQSNTSSEQPRGLHHADTCSGYLVLCEAEERKQQERVQKALIKLRQLYVYGEEEADVTMADPQTAEGEEEAELKLNHLKVLEKRCSNSSQATSKYEGFDVGNVRQNNGGKRVLSRKTNNFLQGLIRTFLERILGCTKGCTKSVEDQRLYEAIKSGAPVVRTKRQEDNFQKMKDAHFGQCKTRQQTSSAGVALI
ncbi:uncharacterized protein [Branchiostoma lanceolatum]|uniref:uncharacterized protein n=1 Tax=Branchiostoma lanceolatum TaxID=7740 RepID=UPI0034572C2A